MKIGVDYYPEHWDRSLWEADADLMQQTGVKLVRMAEFAWCLLEPREGEFDFTWLDEAVSIFAKRGIDIVLCTPTNCPPLWLYEAYPDAVQTGADGKKIATGIRGHRCYHNPDFVRLATRIVDVMTRHYADNKAVVAWQIDNELESNFCFCDTCVAKYHDWLREKYGTPDEINKAYGNTVWSGSYSSFTQIKPPFGSYPSAWLNPAYMLDFNRYASDSMIQYLNMQTDIIRKNCPDAKITTNIWFCEHMPDFYRAFRNMDFVSYDNYPVTALPDDPEECYSHAFHLDLMRGIKQQNFWIMEQLSGGMGCWMPMVRMPYPGMIEGYSLQAFAHGADTVLHFRWRTATTGAEMHWHGLIDHSNIPGRRFSEFAHLCQTAASLDFIEGTVLHSDVAILYSSDNEYAFRIQPQTEGMHYFEQLKLFHDAFSRYGVNIDIINHTDSLDSYRIVVAPTMYVTDDETAVHLHQFVENGGTLILTNRSGVKDQHNNCIMAPLPTVYRDLAGVSVAEYEPIGTAHNTIRLSDGQTFSCTKWCDLLVCESAKVLATYEKDFFQGAPAVTVNAYGNGHAYYIGTVAERSFYHTLIRSVLEQAQIPFADGLPDHVELTTRTGNGKTVRFLFNNTDREQTFCLNGNDIHMKPFEMKIAQEFS